MKIKNWSKKFLWFALGGLCVGFLSFVSISEAQKSQFVKLLMRVGEERVLEDGTKVSLSKADGDLIAVTISKSEGNSTKRNLKTCGESAFNGNLKTTNPFFLRPEGYSSGWISSDPSTVILPDGTTKIFRTQYVLIVEDMSSVQVKGVQRQAGKANTSGCWYSADLSPDIAKDAKTDFCMKKAGGNVAVMYRVSSSGFEELATTATISCP